MAPLAGRQAPCSSPGAVVIPTRLKLRQRPFRVIGCPRHEGGTVYFPDMGQQCQVGMGPEVRAVGWLDIAHPYTRGAVEPAFLEALQRHVKNAWAPVIAAGPHFCQF